MTLIRCILLVLLILLTSCQKATPVSQIEELSATQEISFPVSCGTQTTDVTLKISIPRQAPADQDKYAIALNGSPATQYFESFAQGEDLILSLVRDHGYRVMQLKYPESPRDCGVAGRMSGFYSLCCRQGLPAMFRHQGELIQQILARSGYSLSQHPRKKLVGIGFSLGTVQLTAMAFHHGQEFQRLAFLGVVWGNISQGCQYLSWGSMAYPPLVDLFFGNYADSMSTSGAGCTQRSTGVSGIEAEFTEEYNFDRLPYFNRSHLGIFEARNSFPIREIMRNSTGPAVTWLASWMMDLDYHPATYMASHRPAGTTELFWQEGCGDHHPWSCPAGNGLNRQIIEYLEH